MKTLILTGLCSKVKEYMIKYSKMLFYTDNKNKL